MSKIYIATVSAVEKIPTSRTGVYNQLIKVLPVGSIAQDDARYAYPPSFMPFTETGGGVTSIPNKGALCCVFDSGNDSASNYVYILSYIPYPSVGPEGIYNPEEPETGATVIKVGGEIKSSISVAPEGKMSFYSHPKAFFKLDGSTNTIDSNIDNVLYTFPSGYESYSYNKEHSITGASRVSEYKLVYGKAAPSKIMDDMDLESEKVNSLGAATLYNDKVIIRAGTIYNYDADISINKDKTDIGHVYQLETRQNTLVSNEKDTISILRLGYQKPDNLKYGKDTKYSAGTIIEWAAKRVDSSLVTGNYSSFLLRYGKLAADVSGGEAEETKGEIYRLQLYDKTIDNIGVPILNPLGSGKGWKYELVNLKATEQLTESFGLLSDNSFYRKHIHAYPELSKATLSVYNGTDYTQIIGGDFDNYEETIIWNLGKKGNSLVSTLKSDEYTFVNTQYTSGESTSSESITIAKDNFEINIEVDETTSYNIKLSSGSMIIKLDTGNPSTTTSIELLKEGKININPGTGNTANSVEIGGMGTGHKLVTQEWITQVFDKHMHPTAGSGSPSPPIPMPMLSVGAAPDFVTYITKAE